MRRILRNDKRIIAFLLALVVTLGFMMPQQGIAQSLNNALNFDGINDYVDAGNISAANFGLGNFTIEVWIKTNSTHTANSDIISKRSICNISNFWNLKLDVDGKVFFEAADGSWAHYFSDLKTSSIVNDNLWHHISVTRNGNTLYMYVDGAVSATVNKPFITNLFNTGPLQIGRGACSDLPWGSYFEGTIDEVRIWNFARSATDIQNTMNSELSGSESGLVVYYDFNQGVAGGNNAGVNTLPDLTSNHFSGTLYNFALNGGNSNWVGNGMAPFSPANATANTLYGSTGTRDGGRLITIDPLTGAGALIANISEFGSGANIPRVQALAINSKGHIFGTTSTGGSNILLRIDAVTGEAVKIGQIGVTSFVIGIAFDENDILWGIGGNAQLMTIDTTSGAGTAVGGGTPGIYGAGLAFDPSNGTLYMCQDRGNLYSVNTTDGSSSFIGQIFNGSLTTAIEFDASGNMFGVTGRGSNIPFLSIDKTTGVGTQIGLTGFNTVSGLAFFGSAPVPDTQSPVCTLVGFDPGPPLSAQFSLEDTESGIATIRVERLSNATVEIPEGSGNFYSQGDVVTFSPPETAPVGIRATKVDNNSGASIVLDVTDHAGNSVLCDPVYTTLSDITPEGFALKQNFPNPFNPSTTIHFSVAGNNSGSAPVSIRIYDVSGREIKTLVNEDMAAGTYSIEWDGTNNLGQKVAGGMYLYRMVAGSYTATRKMVLMK